MIKNLLFITVLLTGSLISGSYTTMTLEKPVFSHSHGFYDSSFYLQITTSEPGVQIVYTTDGSDPKQRKAILYTKPVLIDRTTVVRAISKKGSVMSETTTATYIFTGSIIRQPSLPEGYPQNWGPYTAIPGISQADYEMDPDLVADAEDSIIIDAALRHLPVVSISTYKGYLFSNSTDPDTGGIYIYTGPPLTNTTNGTGFGWERPASFEFFDPGGNKSFQANCALQIHGGHSRRPEKSPKHSFRIEFKARYGPPVVDFQFFNNTSSRSYNSLVLRAGFNNTWTHHSASERARAQYIHDAWAKDTFREMGHLSADEIFINLFINGIYWGIYSLSERLDDYYAATWMGGGREEYDVIKDYAEVASGTIDSWNTLMMIINKGVISDAVYKYIQGYNTNGVRDGNIPALLDVTNLADYMLINFFAGNSDWDHHNWVAIRNRVNPGAGFRFYCWDEEKILESVETNILGKNNDNRPSRIFSQLIKYPEFKRLFADRIQKFCFGKGILTPEKNIDRWMIRSDELEPAVPAEAARWGDYRRDVHRYQTAGPFDIYTYENYWLEGRNFILNSYFPQRTSTFIQQLRSAGLFPGIDAPVIRLNGYLPDNHYFNPGDTISMWVEAGTIFYTLDGTDPVNWTGSEPEPSKSSIRYSIPVTSSVSIHIKARNYHNNQWSALSEFNFINRANYSDIKLTEIHYNPEDRINTDGKEYEFIELKNTGISTLNLAGIKIMNGIEYEFRQDLFLRPGNFIVLCANEREFYLRYNIMPDGQYIGHLNNSGETIVLVSPLDDTILSVTYGSSLPWPSETDGDGYSLVPTEINPEGSQDNPCFWRRSYHKGGSPGKDDTFWSDKTDSPQKEKLIEIYPNFPNPANDYTTFAYKLNKDSYVLIEVYNLSGIKIETVESLFKPAGSYLTEWKFTSPGFNKLPVGMYIYIISARSSGNEEQIRQYFIRY